MDILQFPSNFRQIFAVKGSQYLESVGEHLHAMIANKKLKAQAAAVGYAMLEVASKNVYFSEERKAPAACRLVNG